MFRFLRAHGQAGRAGRRAVTEARRAELEPGALRRDLVPGRIRDPGELRAPRADIEIGVGAPEADAGIREVRQDELPEVLGVEGIEDLESVEDAPDDLLLAEAQQAAGEEEFDVGVAKLRDDVVA